jgi:hypothetical protein
MFCQKCITHMCINKINICRLQNNSNVLESKYLDTCISFTLHDMSVSKITSDREDERLILMTKQE